MVFGLGNGSWVKKWNLFNQLKWSKPKTPLSNSNTNSISLRSLRMSGEIEFDLLSWKRINGNGAARFFSFGWLVMGRAPPKATSQERRRAELRNVLNFLCLSFEWMNMKWKRKRQMEWRSPINQQFISFFVGSKEGMNWWVMGGAPLPRTNTNQTTQLVCFGVLLASFLFFGCSATKETSCPLTSL